MGESITFLMSGYGLNPIGGYKVIYEYANRLTKDGYTVHIVYPASMELNENTKITFKIVLRYIYWRIRKLFSKEWFPLKKEIKLHYTLSLDYQDVPKSDIYVATALKTSYKLASYPSRNISKFYFIQGFENWGVSDEFVENSYKLGLNNIVVSEWLKKKVEATGVSCSVIRNGFDFEYFKLSTNISSNRRSSISMLYHKDKLKGCEYGINVMIKLHNKYPTLKFELFGVPRRPKNLPKWIKYYHTPTKEEHNRIYNESMIYIAPSLQEGWGLTVGEAMICGAAIVCTDTQGFREMVKNEKNGLIVPCADIDSLYNAVVRLIESPDLRQHLAKSGNITINQFRWEESYNIFLQLLSK